jgi:hypothetical protein
MGIVFLIWEAVGTPPEDGGPVDLVWLIGFLSFAIGMVLFAIGTATGNVLPRGAAILMMVALVAAIGIDMATGAFFEDEGGDTTQWGFIIGVPVFGLALAWIGYSVWKGRPTTTTTATAPPPAV